MKLTDLIPGQIKRLAALVGCNPDSLRHVKMGRRALSAEMAIKVEKAGRRLKLNLRREDMNSGCAKCEFARKCRGYAALRVNRDNRT